MRTRGKAWVAAAAALVLALALHAAFVTPSTAAGAAPAPDPVRIMVLGDSVAQGAAGDWTWRYRLDRWLAAQELDIDLVGPYRGLSDDPPDGEGRVYDSMAYADPAFDTDHASRWGVRLAAPEFPVADAVRDHEADVLVVARGFNDLFQGAHVADVEAQMRHLVEETRSARPGLDIVLVTATQTWVRQVPEFNEALATVAADMDTPDARVVVAHADVGFSREDTWDGSHATAHGEIMIAAAVADALASIGLGDAYPRPLPEVPLGPRIAPVLTALPGDGEVSLTWERSPGATSHRVWRQPADESEPEALVAEVPGSAWLDTDVVNATDYRYRIQPVKGTTVAREDAWSAPVVVTPLVDLPQSAPEVSVAATGSAEATVTWQTSLGVRDYLVWWRQNTPGDDGWTVRTVTGQRAVLTGLRGGATYEVAVAAVGLNGVGPRSRLVSVLVPGTPPTLPDVVVSSVDAFGTARIEWPLQQGVTSWEVRVRGPNADWVDLPSQTAGQVSLVLPDLRPGTTYEVSVRGWADLVPGPARVVPVPVALVGPARWTRIKRFGARRVRTSVGVIAGADAYELATVTTRRCRHRPSDARFTVRGSARPRTRRGMRVTGRAVWVRWTGLRDGVRGVTGPASYACVTMPTRRKR